MFSARGVVLQRNLSRRLAFQQTISCRITSTVRFQQRHSHNFCPTPGVQPRTFAKRPRFAANYAGSTEASTSPGTAAISPTQVTLQNDTIYALSSGAGVTAGVAIIRVSGPSACFCLKTLLQWSEKERQKATTFPRPRYASVRKLYHPTTKELLDEAMVLYFPGPRSFTGEDVVELHVHGSRAVIAGVIEALGEMGQFCETSSTVRPAERGEFTRRAFENGRMDLTSVEGLSDLISAETTMQRRQALRQLGGEVRDLLERWRAEIKTCLAHAEAVIDFGDDVDEETFEAIVPRIEALHDEMERYLNDRHRGEIVRGGARVAIVGEPNAGKSTLLNALARRPAAIVSPQEGTTRDIVEVQLDLNGLAVIVSDTAGLREETTDPIEMEGMRRAQAAAAIADVTVLVHDASRGGLRSAVADFPSRLNAYETAHDRAAENSDLICVANKIDLVPGAELEDFIHGVKIFKTSLVNNTGISELTRRLEQILRERLEGTSNEDFGVSMDGVQKQLDVPVITRARHRHHLMASVSALSSFLHGRTGPDRSLYLPMDLAAEDLRIAAKELGSITGIIHAEEVLDLIFGEFCIGK